MGSLWILPVSYIVGLVPSAYIAARLVKGVDIRKTGDGNMGAANVYRNIGHTAGIAVLAADVAKGALPVLLASAGAAQPVVFLCGLAVVAGHNWPPFFRFSGGRGLAPTIGILLVLLPLPASIASLAGIVSLWTTHKLVITGVVMFVPLLVLALLLGAQVMVVVYALGLLCLAGVMHLITTRHLSPDQRKEALRW